MPLAAKKCGRCFKIDLWLRVKCVCILITHDLREAVYLSDTVYVMGPRPSSILYKLEIDLPRPRTLEMSLTDEFKKIARTFGSSSSRLSSFNLFFPFLKIPILVEYDP